MNEYVIYKLTSPSGKVYIGRTNDFDGRMACHKYNSLKNSRYPIYRAIRKYGWDNFTKEIIYTGSNLNESGEKESEYIIFYDSVKKGYNATYKTDGSDDIWEGFRDTPKYKDYLKKMSILLSGENNGMYGKKHSDDAKEKQKAKAKGRFSLPWFIEKYGETEGTRKYKDRGESLSKRHMNRNEIGDFIPKDQPNRFVKK